MNETSSPAEAPDHAVDSANATSTSASESHEDFYILDPNHIKAERISGLIFSFAVFVGVAFGLLFKILHSGIDLIFWIILLAGLLVLAWSLFMAIAWPRISYRHIRWRLDETGLEIHRGVIWRNRASIPLARVQHADVTQGPIQRNFNLGTLAVHTAGTIGASVDLAGLNYQIALGLRDRLVRQKRAGESIES